MAVETQNALDRFVSKTRALFAQEPDLEQRWTLLRPILAELLADPTLREASKNWPQCTHRDGRAENLLFYEDPDYQFAVNGIVVNEHGLNGQSLGRIHDHAHIYTLYGILDGHERIERYERIDDRSKPDYAEIRRTGDSLCGPGDIDFVRPYEIHREVSIGEKTLSVIIRSEKSGSFNQGRYEPDTNRYYESLGPRQTPVAMFS